MYMCMYCVRVSESIECDFPDDIRSLGWRVQRDRQDYSRLPRGIERVRQRLEWSPLYVRSGTKTRREKEGENRKEFSLLFSDALGPFLADRK